MRGMLKMMKMIFLAGALLGATGALAAQGGGSIGVSSHAGEIARRFADAVEPARVEDMVAWMSGRCYMAGTPNTAMASLLVVEEREEHHYDGPIFDEKVTKHLVLVAPKERADYYDELSSSVRLETAGLVDTAWPALSPTFRWGGSLACDWVGAAHSARYLVRVDDEYVYVRAAQPATNQTIGYCYFFRRVNN